MELSNTISTGMSSDIKSRRSKNKSKSLDLDNFDNKKFDSETDISMGDLELLANKKKLNKKASESISISKDESDVNVNHAKTNLNNNQTYANERPQTNKNVNNYSDTMSTRSTSSYERERIIKQKRALKENKNDDIRREKSEFLYKISVLNAKGNRSILKFDMSNSLEDIRNEYERIRVNMENERMVKFCKQMLLMGVQGVEMLNNKFDPMGVDLDGWSESMGYSMEQQDYDEVISELYEKYKGKGQMAPELKLVLMIIGSAAMFTITKKITKMDTNSQGNMLSGLLGSMMNAPRQPPQAQPQYVPQQQPQQQPQQNMYNKQSQPHLGNIHSHGNGYGKGPIGPMGGMGQGSQFRVPTLGPVPYGIDLNKMDNMSEDSDMQPSRMRGPDGAFDSPDSINLQDIMKTMAQNKRMKELEANKNKFELSFDEPTEEEVIKNVSLKNKRGRPAKKNKGKAI